MRTKLLLLLLALLIFPPILHAEDVIAHKLDMFIMFTGITGSGEDLIFEVVVFNPNDEEVVLTFGSPLQIDYTIDDSYRYSSARIFPAVVTSVTIPAHNQHEWRIQHESKEYELQPGFHRLTALLTGYQLNTSIEFSVPEKDKTLPEGVVLSLAMSKESYARNEQPIFTLTAVNSTDSDILLPVTEVMPVKYRIVYESQEAPDDSVIVARDTDVFSYKPVKIDTVLPAGESLQWEQAIDTGYYFYPGEYTLAAGLSGYESEVSTGFTIDDTEIFGTVSGTLLTYADDGSTMIPIGGATVDVWSEPRRKPMPYITDDYDPNQEMLHWNTVTDSDGYFIFEEVPVWWFYTVDIRKDGYTPFTESFMNSKGQYVLKPVIKRILEEAPLNYRYTKIDDLEVSIGTSSSIYDPQSVFKGHLTVLNHGVEPISFEFEDNHYITWTFASEYGDMYEIRDGKICINPREGYDNSAYENIGSSIVIEPGDSWTFTLADSLDTLLPVRTGIYKFNGSLAFVSSSNERLNPGEVSCSLKFLVEKSTYTRIDTNIDDDKYVVDLQDSLHTTLDLYMKGYASGEIHLTEFCENPYDSIKDHNFIKIVDIDIDSGIRANIDHALVKIYFDPDDYQNPQNLVIAHWKEEEQITGDVPPQKSTGNWEILETTVDLDNNCAEAYTTTFSSFGLFESYEPTAVDEGMKPDRFALLQNQPNPFNPSTTLSFTLPDAGDTRLIVYNVSGQEVARLVDGPMPAGTHQVVFDALQMASGVYFYRIVCNGFTATKRMMFVR